jgi:chromosome segregation ATPase
LEPLGFTTGLLLGAAVAVLLPERLDRVRRNGHRLTVLETRLGDQVEQVSTLRQRVVTLESDGLELEGRITRNAEVASAVSDALIEIKRGLDELALDEDKLEALNQGLLEMQQFIVKAAEDARSQREQLVRPAPDAAAALPQDVQEMMAMMASLPKQQEVFAARRRAAAAANFKQPAGGGL